MGSKGSGGGIIAAIIAVIGIIIFIVSRGSVSSLFRTLGIIFLIIVAVAVVALILIIIFAARSSKKNQTGTPLSSLRPDKPKLNEEQMAVVNKGRQDLMAIRRKLVTIKNSEVRTKGNEVCASMDRVFKILKEKPEKIPGTRQFLNYYIPTVAKVTQKYQSLESGKVPTSDMTGKVITFFDDVKAAMEKQCTHLYEDDMLDMTVDMEAMTMAIKRDGLLDSHDFQQTEQPASTETQDQTDSAEA